MSEEKKTFVERVFGSFFSAQTKDAKGFLLVITVMYAIWITQKYINQNDRLHERIEQEVRLQVRPAVKQEVEPIKQKVDTASKIVQGVSDNIDNFIKTH